MTAGGAAVIAAGGAAAAMRRTFESADSAWAPYAQSRAMHYRAGRMGWAHTQWPRVEGALDRVPIALELVQESFDYATAALALPTAMLSGHLEVTLEGWAARITKIFGAQDIRVGDEAFDRAYLVKATSDALSATLLSPAVRAEALALALQRIAFDDGSEHGHQPLAMVILPGVVRSADVLDRALRLVVALARTAAPNEPYR